MLAWGYSSSDGGGGGGDGHHLFWIRRLSFQSLNARPKALPFSRLHHTACFINCKCNTLKLHIGFIGFSNAESLLTIIMY